MRERPEAVTGTERVLVPRTGWCTRRGGKQKERFERSRGAESTGVPDGLQFVSLGGESETDRSGRKRKKSGNGQNL